MSKLSTDGQEDSDRLPGFAEELVRRNVALVVTLGGTAATLAAKAASTTIPIVFAVGDDPRATSSFV